MLTSQEVIALKIHLTHLVASMLFRYCTYRPKDDPGLCCTEEGLGSQNDPIRLRACETDDIRQKWVNDKAFNSKPDRDKNKPFQIKTKIRIIALHSSTIQKLMRQCFHRNVAELKIMILRSG